MEKFRKIIQQEVRRAIMEAEAAPSQDAPKISQDAPKTSAFVGAIMKDLTDQGTNFKNIDNAIKFQQLFDGIVDQITAAQNVEDASGLAWLKTAINTIRSKYNK